LDLEGVFTSSLGSALSCGLGAIDGAVSDVLEQDVIGLAVFEPLRDLRQHVGKGVVGTSVGNQRQLAAIGCPEPGVTSGAMSLRNWMDGLSDLNSSQATTSRRCISKGREVTIIHLLFFKETAFSENSGNAFAGGAVNHGFILQL
jgi:hypothetical protein